MDKNNLILFFQYDRAGIKNRQGDQDPHRRAKVIISKLDIGGDKKLDKQEFINGYFL